MKINYVDKDLYSKPILLDRSIADKVQSNLYFDANTDRNYGLTYFLTINKNTTDYVSDQFKKLKEMQNQVDLRADIRIISLISGRTLVDIQDSQKNTKNYKININERSILRPIYFGGIIGSGVDLNKKLLSTKIDTADTYPSLVTVRKLFSSSTDVADKNLKDNAEVYLLEYLKDKMQGGKLTYSWDEKIELNLDDVLSLFIPILTDGLSLETYYVDKIDDINGNQIYLHKDDGKGGFLKVRLPSK